MIKIINIDSFIKEHECIGPVLSPEIYFSKTRSFHPKGIFSEEIFGLDGSLDRRNSFSWVELNTYVIHPLIYDILKKRVFRKIDLLISGETSFSIDKEGYLIEDENGEINGMTDFVKNIERIRFSENEDDEEGDRNKIIHMLYDNIHSGLFFIKKLICISPDMRPVMVLEETDEVRVDEISKIYQKIIQLSSHLKGVSDTLYDILTFRMQLLLRDLYELMKVKIGKKSGLIRNLALGRRVDFSARSVIIPGVNLPVGTVGIPLRVAVMIFEPFMLYGLLNSSYADNIPQEFHDECFKFLDKESSLLDV